MNGNIPIDRQWHTRVLDVQLLRAAECGNDHFLVVANVKDRLSVSKQNCTDFILRGCSISGN
jgi:hypothetical protein